MPKTKATKPGTFQVALVVSYTLTGLALVFLAVRGLSYYTTPMGQRPFHPDYGLLRPAGNLGLWYGVLGSFMMVSLLAYSLRKRTRIFGRIFRLKAWLDVHILFGIMGPLFILLHTSFKLGGLVAVSFWSMVAVALSGVLGRYLYVQIPRNIKGGEITLQELEQQDRELDRALEAYPPETWQKITQFTEKLIYKGDSKLGFLFWLLFADIRRVWAFSRISRQIKGRYGHSRALIDAIELAKRKAVLHRRILLLDRINSLFHRWHVIHRPFAIVMYLIMFIHIGVALMFGISWRT